MKLLVKNNGALRGEISINGSKNAALPIIAAALLTAQTCIVQNVPNILDIHNMAKLLNSVGAQSTFDNNTLITTANNITDEIPNSVEAGLLRASILLAGPLLARLGRVKIPLPGGCKIGVRPIDLHLKGFETLGAKVALGEGFISAHAKKLVGARIYLDFPSVGATENLLMAATLAEGETIIENAAIEPEIIDLCNFLISIGAEIKGGGSDTINIIGKKSLHGADYSIIPDRIEAGTFMLATAITNGKTTLKNINSAHLKPISAKLRECGAKIFEYETALEIDATEKLHATDIKTLPFPGFPTDLQAPWAALMATAKGNSMVVETIFENRFMYVPELIKMGAKIKIDGRSAIIEGKKSLTPSVVKASDLRAGAALTLAALAAEGETEIENAELILRGYENFDKRLTSLGAQCIMK